ncbi:mitochondrial ribosome-associated GTPase 1-like isoform X2 [Clytia hemisphaerica]
MMTSIAVRKQFKFPVYFTTDVFHKVLPFHMAKGMQVMRGMVNNCDCVIEVRDARVPLSSCNKQFEYLYAHKPRILLINKIDLANESLTKVMRSLKQILRQKNEQKSIAGGKPMKALDDSSFKALVCGVPNVGKSSFINAARQRYLRKGGKATPVGRKPGVTRSVLTKIVISRNPKISILDTPGIISPYLKDPMTGIKLALTGTFPDHVIGEEVIADYLLYAMNQQKVETYLELCGLDSPTDDFENLMQSIAEKYDFLRGSEPDYRKCSIKLINAYRRGHLGPLTLDSVT